MGLFSNILGAGSAVGGFLSDIIGGSAQRRLQEQAWKREDNAVQRRVADLKAAGLSPTLAAGSAAQASGPIFASKGVQQQSEAPMKVLSFLQMKADIARTSAETLRLREEAREKKMLNDAMSKPATYQRINPVTGIAEYSAGDTSQLEQKVFYDLQRMGSEASIAWYREQVERWNVTQAEYDNWKRTVKQKNPDMSEPVLELMAMAAAVQAAQQANEIQEMNLKFYRGSPVPPVVIGAGLDAAKGALPHGLYKIP